MKNKIVSMNQKCQVHLRLVLKKFFLFFYLFKFKLFQRFEEERLQFLKQAFQRIAEIQSSLPPAFEACAKDYIQVAKDMTVAGDIQEFIEENICAVVNPSPLEYVPYETDNLNFKLSTTTEATGISTKSVSNSDISSLDAPSPQQVGFLLFFC